MGRGTLSNLNENNYEFGAWSPVNGGGGGGVAGQASNGAAVVEKIIEKMDYFPPATSANPAEAVKISRSGELILENSREERDCKQFTRSILSSI